MTVVMFRDVLESTGAHTVAAVFNGIAGLQFLGVEPTLEIKTMVGEEDWKFVKNDWTSDPAEIKLPDLILSDCMMPRMDGLTFVTQASLNKRVKTIPVLVLTSKTKMEEPFLQLPNVKGFITKPVNPHLLLATVDKILAKA